MNIGSETGIEGNQKENMALDDQDYRYIALVIFSLVSALIGLLTLIYFLAWGNLNETLKQITPVVQTSSKK